MSVNAEDLKHLLKVTDEFSERAFAVIRDLEKELAELKAAVNWWSAECERLDNDYSLNLDELLKAYREREVGVIASDN